MSEELTLVKARWLIDHKEAEIQRLLLKIDALTAEYDSLKERLKTRDETFSVILADRNELKTKLEKAKAFHHRAMKLIDKQKNFLVVACDESYYRQVYDLIRDNEMLKGTWTIEDENHYVDAFTKIKEE